MWRCTWPIGPIPLLVVTVLFPLLCSGSAITDILFGQPARLLWGGSSDVHFACSLDGCTELPAHTRGAIRLHVRPDGDYIRIVDTTFRTIQWLVWGNPTVPWSHDVMWGIARKHGCLDTWMATETSTWPGVTWNGHAWTPMLPPSTHTCLGTYGADDVVADGDATNVTGVDETDDVVALHLTVESRQNLVFSRWLTNGRLPCDAAPHDPFERTTSDIWLSANDEPEGFWKYTRERHVPCSTDELQRQVAAVMGCLGVSTLRSSNARHAWELPFYPTPTTTSTDETSWHAQRLHDWTQQWAVSTVPVFLCATQYGDTTTLHSIVLLFDLPSRRHPFRLRTAPFVDTHNLLLQLALPAFVAVCPPYFLV